MNELAVIFKKMNIDTLEVLQAAGTNGTFFHSVQVLLVDTALVLTLTT